MASDTSSTLPVSNPLPASSTHQVSGTTTGFQRIVLVSNMYPDATDPGKGTFIKTIHDSLEGSFPQVERIVLANTNGKLAKVKAYLRFYAEVFHCLMQEAKSISGTDGNAGGSLFYVHYVSLSAPPFLLAGLLGRRPKVVAHAHGSDVALEGNPGWLSRTLKFRAARSLMKHSLRVIAPSSYFRRFIADLFALPESHISISPSGGVNPGVFHPLDRRLDALADTNSSGRRALHLGFVGRLTRDKGIYDFLNAVEALRAQGLEVRATVAGNGPEAQAVKAAPYVTYHAYLTHEELAALYRDLDLFLFPTQRASESLGLVGIEAMACGTPVVAYRGTGPETYIADGVNGFLVDRADWRMMSTVAAKYASIDGDTRAAMACAAVATAGTFATDVVTADLVAQLRAL